jgi:hypothetical protein
MLPHLLRLIIKLNILHADTLCRKFQLCYYFIREGKTKSSVLGHSQYARGRLLAFVCFKIVGFNRLFFLIAAGDTLRGGVVRAGEAVALHHVIVRGIDKSRKWFDFVMKKGL